MPSVHDRETPSPGQVTRAELDDSAAWHTLGPLLAPYLPWSSGALRPAGLVRVLNEIWFRRPRLVVELGSGVSTIVTARLLRALGAGRLLAVEHDARWADRVRAQLAHENLNDHAAVVRAPLRPHERSWDGAEWYDEEVIARALDDAADLIEVLVVDGPPAWEPGAEHARFPALGVLADRLAPGAAVLLDDIERPGEQEVLERWRQEHAVDYVTHQRAGVALGIWPAASVP